MFNRLLKRKEAALQLRQQSRFLFPLVLSITLVPALWIRPPCTGQVGLDLVLVLFKMHVQLRKHD